MGSLGAPFHAAALHKGLRIGPATVAEIENAPNLRVISREFTEESLAPGLPRSAPNWPAYRALEAAGLLHPITARLDGLLIGFVGVLLAPPIATTERIFVLKAHRKSGAGLKLLHVAEEAARRLGSPVLQVVAPIDGGLSKVLPRVGYRESNRVFFKILPVAT
jgi:GNAT superfamily N-acetyltransferase